MEEAGGADHDPVDVAVRHQRVVVDHMRHTEALRDRPRLQVVRIRNRRHLNVGAFRQDRQVHELAGGSGAHHPEPHPATPSFTH